MLRRDAGGVERGLQLRDIQPEDSHDEREEHSGEQVPVLRKVIEERRVLEDAETAGAERHQGEPLYDDEIDKVYAGGLVETGVVEVLVNVGGHVAVAEPEVAEGDAVAFQVPVGHGKGGHVFKDADKAV